MPLITTLANASARGYGGLLAAAGGGPSYESIATVTVGSGGQSTISFSSIPATYKHLQVRWIARSANSSGGDTLLMSINSGSADRTHALIGNGSATGSEAYTLSYFGNMSAGTSPANAFGAGVADILDYTDTNKNRVGRSLSGHDNNGSGGEIFMHSWLKASTTAISSITFTIASSANFDQYSNFALYGVRG